MFKVSDTAKLLIRNSVLVSLVMLVVYAIIDFDNILPFTLGMIFGLLFTISKIILLEKNINRAVNLSGVKADNYMKLHFLFRYILTAVVLAVAGMMSGVALIGCALAMISLKFSANAVNFQNRKTSKAES